jgi:hypothetical protein
MPRDLPSPMITAVTSNLAAPCILVDLTLATGVQHVWSGVGSLLYGGNTYLGVGSLGQIGDVTEGSDVKADGTTITLSGIDATLLNDCLLEIQLGAPVTVWFAVFQNGGILGAPYPLFVGTVDQPVVPISPDTIAITLKLESRMANLQRPSNRRYTASDQTYYFPTDSGFNWVETLNDIALVWG